MFRIQGFLGFPLFEQHRPVGLGRIVSELASRRDPPFGHLQADRTIENHGRNPEAFRQGEEGMALTPFQERGVHHNGQTGDQNLFGRLGQEAFVQLRGDGWAVAISNLGWV
jgi:hypothetical protein